MSAPLWVAEAGPPDAPLIAVIHGAMDRSAGVLRVSRALDAEWRVLRYDRRGYGKSVPHPGPFGLDQQVADLVGALAGRRAVLFGHSYGGNVALAIADRHPDLVAAVAVYETPLSWLPSWPGTTAGATALATQGDPADAAERFMRRLIGEDRWNRLPPSRRADRRAEGPAMVGELTDLRQRPAWDARRIHVPTVAMFGEFGAAHHREAMEFLSTEFQTCRTVMIAGARHFGPNTHAEHVAAEITQLARDARHGEPRVG